MKGNILISNGTMRSNIGQYIKSLPDGSYFYSITKPKRIRSLDENAYYHGVIVKILSDYWGYEPEEVHEILKLTFLSEKKRMKHDRRKKMVVIWSTASLSVAEFEQYCEKIRVWAAKEFSVFIPLPNQITDQIFDK